MRPADLYAEFRAALDATAEADLGPLLAAGAGPAIAVGVVPALTRIRLCSGGTFEPDPDGNEAYILPVRIPEPPDRIEAIDPLAVVRSGPIIDLVAFHHQARGRWALRAGIATVLGAVGPQRLAPPPEPVYRDITEWLRSGCRGIVLLTHDRGEAQRIIRDIWCIEAEDEAHRAELWAIAMAALPTAPKFIVRGRRELVA